MNDFSPSTDKGRARRLIVTLLIGTAAAAVTAGVALNERRPGEAVVSHAQASPAPTGGAVAAPAEARRVEWRDPWKRPAPLSALAPSSTGSATDASATSSDPSLPAAAQALKDGASHAGESAPTF